MASISGAPGTVVRDSICGVIPGTSNDGRGSSAAGALSSAVAPAHRKMAAAIIIATCATTIRFASINDSNFSLAASCGVTELGAQLELLQPLAPALLCRDCARRANILLPLFDAAPAKISPATSDTK